MGRIVVFCASAELTQPLHELARALGAAIGAGGHELVYGGTAMGLMREVAAGARAAGGRVVGVLPAGIADGWTVDVELDERVDAPTMGERKRLLLEGADRVVVLPGGIGTLDELFEAMTLRHVGVLPRSLDIVLLDPSGVWTPLLEQLDHLVALGAVSTASARLRVAQRVEDVLQLGSGGPSL